VTHSYSAICKSDCILLEIDVDMITFIKELRIKQDFENQAAFLLKFMPKLSKVYTHQTLGKLTQKYLKK